MREQATFFFTVGACVFWLYAFALRRISRLVSRLRGDFSFGRIGHHCDTHDKWPTVLIRSLCLTWFSLRGCSISPVALGLERLFGAVFCRQVVDVNHNVQVNNL